MRKESDKFTPLLFLCNFSLALSLKAALMWSKKYCDSTNSNLHEVLGSFLEYIHFHVIPANVLMKEIHPLGLVPSHIIMNALAYQVGEQKREIRFRYSADAAYLFPTGRSYVC